MHSELPTLDVYFPALQMTHVPPFGPENPALQRQLVSAGLTLGACEFDGQFWQVALPDTEN
jgi:hypothetical protein